MSKRVVILNNKRGEHFIFVGGVPHSGATLVQNILDSHPEIYGRFGEWEYFNMDHSIMSGKRTADKINSLFGSAKQTQATVK